MGLKAAFRKNYVESILAQSDFRLSAETEATAGKINKQLQNPENFAEFMDVPSDLGVGLNRLKINNWSKGRELSSEAINVHTVPEMKYSPYKYGTMVRDIEIGVGEKLYCVESIDQLNPGSWIGEKFFNTEREAREYFAIIPEFKDLKLQLLGFK